MVSLTILGGAGAGVAWRWATEVAKVAAEAGIRLEVALAMAEEPRREAEERSMARNVRSNGDQVAAVSAERDGGACGESKTRGVRLLSRPNQDLEAGKARSVCGVGEE